MSAPPRPLVVVDDALLDAMIADAGLRESLASCLGPLAAAEAKACGKCGGRPRRPREAYAAAKACLAFLDDEGRRRLKAALRASQVRVVVPGDKVPTTYQF